MPVCFYSPRALCRQLVIKTIKLGVSSPRQIAYTGSSLLHAPAFVGVVYLRGVALGWRSPRSSQEPVKSA